MTRRRSHGLEAYSGRDLSLYIEREHGGELVDGRQTSGSHIVYRLPDGRTVGSLVGGYVPTVMAKTTASALGLTLHELREGLGRPTVQRHGGGPKHKVDRFEPTPVTKGDVIVALELLAVDVAGLDALRYGQRDAAFYREVLPVLTAARAALAKMPGALSTWEPPVGASA